MKKNIDFSKILLLDGAMGTMLQSHGLATGELPESYNILKPDIIEKIHSAYATAGCDIVTTNTFGANAIKLQKYGYSVEKVVGQAVEIAKKAVGQKLVALDIGPIGQLMEPYGLLSFAEAYKLFAQQIIAGSKAGADLILIETMSDLLEAKAAILAAKENSDLPVICTMTFQQEGRTLTGTDPLTMVNVLQGLGVDALGINCSLGPKEINPLLDQILAYAKVPVIVQPNAGMPQIVNGETVFNIAPEDFANEIKLMAAKGVTIFGGCCGTTPSYIEVMKETLANTQSAVRKVERITATSSANTTVVLGQGVKVIGERINPTGKKKLKEALKKNQMDYILQEAIRQRDAGAHVLDVNVGLPEINEVEMMVQTVKELQSIVNLPLQIDSSQPEVIEAAVRIYNGKPIINSVNGKEESMQGIFPIVKKYGAVVIGLTLDETGIPTKAEDRLKVAEKIVNRAKEYGIDKEDIIIDCLTLTASAQQEEVRETIKAVVLVKERLGVKTTLGVSNVSFGLPKRELLNKTFLATALTAGLDAPIIDPLSQEMMDTISAFNVLWNYDSKSQAYIKKHADSINQDKMVISSDQSSEKTLIQMVIDGLKDEAEAKTQQLLESISGMEVMDKYLIPALDVVGNKYERGEIFLPQLIQSAEAVKKAFQVIKDQMGETAHEEFLAEKDKILLATVKGDIHDIGKNIVKVLLENYGFTVVDMGKDVDIHQIVAKVKEDNIKLVGLSALMTTTVKNMEETIKAIKKEVPSCHVMVGGAVLNSTYAEMMGAEYYAKDAREGVEIAKKFFQTM